MNVCTCVCVNSTSVLMGNGYVTLAPNRLCEFCVANIWAAMIEQRLGVAEHMLDEGAADNDRFVMQDNLEHEVKGILDSEEIPSTSDVERAIEEALKDQDTSDYVTEDSLEAAIVTALEDVDIVQQVAAGAAEGAMGRVETYRRQVEERMEQLSTLVTNTVLTLKTNEIALANLSFGGRLRWLLTGRI